MAVCINKVYFHDAVILFEQVKIGELFSSVYKKGNEKQYGDIQTKISKNFAVQFGVEIENRFEQKHQVSLVKTFDLEQITKQGKG